MQKIVQSTARNTCGHKLEILSVKIVSKRAINSPQYPQKTEKIVLHCSCKIWRKKYMNASKHSITEQSIRSKVKPTSALQQVANRQIAVAC